MKTKKNETVRRSNVRTLKIEPKTRFNRYSRKDVPEIKLCGNWLQNLGFKQGERVIITAMPNLLIIQC